jgi:hypothetical protein
MRFISAAAAIAVFLSSSHVQTISNKSDSDTAIKRIDTLWLVTFVNDEGIEAVAQAKIASGENVPLIAADNDRLQSIIESGKALAASRKIKLRLVEFSHRSDVGEFSP